MSNETAQIIASLGSELEHTIDNAWRIRFSRELYRAMSGWTAEQQGALRHLAHFASSKGSAVCERLAGRIDVAGVYEGHAESAYARLPEGCRW